MRPRGPALSAPLEGAKPRAGRPEAVERGVVKWFDSRMGYGFIVDTAGRDVFVHRRVVRRAGRRRLEPGEPVEYEAEVTPRGIKITHLVVLERAEPGPTEPGHGA